MSLSDQLLSRAAPPVSETGLALREEIIEAARASAGDDGVLGRVDEIVALLALRLRMRSRRQTGDDRATLWGSGASIGSTVLIATLLLETAGDVVSEGLGGSGLGLAALAMATTAMALVVRHRPLSALALVSIGATFHIVQISSRSASLTPALTLAAMIVITLAISSIGTTADRRVLKNSGSKRHPLRNACSVGPEIRKPSYLQHPSRGRLRWPLLMGAAAVLIGAWGLTGTAVFGLTAVLPLLLLICGSADPRLAVAAFVIWLWRLIAIDLSEVTNAAELLARDLTVDQLLVRWAFMTVGVVFAWHVAQRSVQRAAAI